MNTDEFRYDLTELVLRQLTPRHKMISVEVSCKGLLTPFTWHSLVNDLRGLNDVRVPRCYFKRTDEQPTSYQVHGFCDASDNAFAAVVYLRTEHRTGEVEVNPMASKTRVAPIKKQTTPRLELMGANLLARLTDSILRASTSLRATPEVILWTDSFTTLCWIKNNKAWKQYVQHRVNEIRELANKHQWRHCPGELEPCRLALSRMLRSRAQEK